MKLLMISTDQKLCEPNSAVARRLTDYAKNFEELHIIVFTQNQHAQEIALSSNCWVYPTRSKIKLSYTLDATRLGRFIVGRRGITHVTCQDPFLTGMVGVSLKKQFGLHLELQIHTDISSPYFTRTLKNRIFKTMALSYLPKADHIRVVAGRVFSYLVDVVGIDVSKIELRPIAVNTEAIKVAPVSVDLFAKYPQFEKIVLMASRLEVEKNIGLALEAFRLVTKQVHRVGLVIVGEGSQKDSIKKDIIRLGLSQVVILEPWADHRTLFSYYKTADLFLLTSFFEGYGMTIIEAQAAGCPIISTDVGVAREADATIVGYNAHELAEQIVQVLQQDN
jgi:glycosyltransferase involved in cell wall biosynthesis